MTPAERQTIKELLDSIGTFLPSMKLKDAMKYVSGQLRTMPNGDLYLLCRYFGCPVDWLPEKIVRDKLGKE